MGGEWVILAAGLLLGAAPGEVTLPAEARIPARVVRALEASPASPMHMPTDVAVDRAGRVYVADGTNDRILRFSAAGAFEAAITRAARLSSPKSAAETFSQPVGIALDAKDQLWVADSGHHRVLVLAPDGGLVAQVELPTPAGGRPSDPTDLAVTPDGRRTYIVDNDNHRVLIRDNQGQTLTALGRFGRALGQFEWPFMIALAPGGDVYVSEAAGARLQRIGPRDSWAGEVGRWGGEIGQLYRPKGVVADAAGRIYVSDSTLQVVQVFTSLGSVSGVLTGTGAAAGQPLRFRHPMGLALDVGGRLYVVELGANRVAVVELAATASAPATAPAGRGGAGP